MSHSSKMSKQSILDPATMELYRFTAEQRDTSKYPDAQTNEMLKSLFTYLDVEKNDYLNPQDIATYLNQQGVHVSKDQIKYLLSDGKFAVQDDTQISLDEFTQLLKKEGCLKSQIQNLQEAFSQITSINPYRMRQNQDFTSKENTVFSSTLLFSQMKQFGVATDEEIELLRVYFKNVDEQNYQKILNLLVVRPDTHVK